MSEPRPPEDLLRRLGPQVLGILVRRYGNFADCEDAVQEALLQAALRWREGVPAEDTARAWLLTASTHRLLDARRKARARQRREEHNAREVPPSKVPAYDDALLLLFLGCHPALTPASSIALTLRAVGGLTTAEIAAAYLVPEPTMAQRISRAKDRIRATGPHLPAPDPGDHDWPRRLGAVKHVLYLMFNEGYASLAGPTLQRADLCREAIRLARGLHQALPEEAEVTGLLALLLLTDARRPARTGPGGELIPLAEQDRTLWEGHLVKEGTALLNGTLGAGAPLGPYRVQAAIAALHDAAPRADQTDWAQIHGLYLLLERLAPSPIVTLNRAVALAMVDGPTPALALLDDLGDHRGPLDQHHRLHAVRAHLLEMAGEVGPALAEYERAAAGTASGPEQRYLVARASRLRSR